MTKEQVRERRSLHLLRKGMEAHDNYLDRYNYSMRINNIPIVELTNEQLIQALKDLEAKYLELQDKVPGDYPRYIKKETIELYSIPVTEMNSSELMACLLILENNYHHLQKAYQYGL